MFWFSDNAAPSKFLPMGRFGRFFSLSPPVSSTNKADRHNIAEIVLKVAFNTINQPNHPKWILL
jgi:hypothetical protein